MVSGTGGNLPLLPLSDRLEIAHSGDKLTVDTKLALVGRSHALGCFNELRNDVLETLCLEKATYPSLYDSPTLDDCIASIKCAASVLWPQCIHGPRRRGLIFLDVDLRQPVAVVSIFKEDQDKEAVRTVRLNGKQKTLAPHLCCASGLYSIFEAILDCEIAVLEGRSGQAPSVRPCNESSIARENGESLADTPEPQTERRRSKEDNYSSWPPTRLSKIKSGTLRVGKPLKFCPDGETRLPRGEVSMSPLRAELKQSSHDVDFFEWAMGWKEPLPTSMVVLPRIKGSFNFLSTIPPRHHQDAKVLATMLAKAALHVRGPLADELREFECWILHRTGWKGQDEGHSAPDATSNLPTNEEAAESADTPQLSLEQPPMQAEGDKINIRCSFDIPTKTTVRLWKWKSGEERWEVTIHLRRGRSTNAEASASGSNHNTRRSKRRRNK